MNNSSLLQKYQLILENKLAKESLADETDPRLLELLKTNNVKKFGVIDIPSAYKKHLNGGGYVGKWTFVPDNIKVPEDTIVIGTSPTVKTAQIWLSNGMFHRIGGPAVTDTDGSKHYYEYDQLNRLNGPAREWSNGNKEYYIGGQRYSSEPVYKTKIQALKKGDMKTLLHPTLRPPPDEEGDSRGDKTPDGESTLRRNRYGVKRWINKKGQLHNWYGPAYKDSYVKQYWLNGKQYYYKDWKEKVKRRRSA